MAALVDKGLLQLMGWIGRVISGLMVALGDLYLENSVRYICRPSGNLMEGLKGWVYVMKKW